MSDRNRRLVVAGLAVVGLGVAFMLPAYQSRYIVFVVTSALILGILTMSFGIVYGVAGLPSFAQQAFFGFGAYAAAIVADRSGSGELLLPVLVGIAGGVLPALAIAVICRTLHGHYMAVATLALASVFALLVLELEGLTGGFSGLIVPVPELFGHRLTESEMFRVCLVLAVVALIAAHRVIRSPIGRRFAALHDDEVVVRSLGVSTFGVRLVAFGVSGAFCGLAGGLFALNTGFIAAANFDVNLAITLLLMAILGGLRSLPGAFVGAGLVVAMQQGLARLGEYNSLASSALLLALILFAPGGLAALLARWMRRRRTATTLAPAATATAPPPAPAANHAARESTLELSGVSVHFGGLRALDDVSLAIPPGQITGLIGPNGAGKTTLLDVAAGFRVPTKGSVRLDGRDVSRMSAERRSRLGVVRSFQQARALPLCTVADNVRVAAEARSWAGARERADEVMARVGILDIRDAITGELGFAERRLVEIARTLALQPSVILLDEPFAGLDIGERQRVADLIVAMREDRLAVLLIEHDIEQVMSLCDQVAVLAAGRLISYGTPQHVWNDAVVRTAYLGLEPAP